MEIPSWGAFFSVTLASWLEFVDGPGPEQVSSRTCHRFTLTRGTSPALPAFFSHRGSRTIPKIPGFGSNTFGFTFQQLNRSMFEFKILEKITAFVEFISSIIMDCYKAWPHPSASHCVRHLLQRWRDGCPCPFAPWDTQQNEMREELKIWPTSEDRLALFLKTPFWGPPDASGEI